MPRKKSEKTERLTLYYTYKENRTGGEPDDPNDRWSSRKDEYVDWALVDVLRNEPKNTPYWEHTELMDSNVLEPNVPVYAVFVRYETGDTFGRSYGNGVLAGVFLSEEKAIILRDKIINKTDTWDDIASGCYKQWSGYFDRLEDCFISLINVLDN